MARYNFVTLIILVSLLIVALTVSIGALKPAPVSAMPLGGTRNMAEFSAGKAALTITANDAFKNYGEELVFTGTEFTASGLEAGDAITSVTLTSAGAAADAWPGTYPIVPGNAKGLGLADYDITYVNGTLTIPLKSPPRRISIATPPVAAASVEAPLPTQPAILVRDRYNDPLSDITVTASRNRGSGILRGTLSAITDSRGLATFTDLGYNKSGEIFTIHFAAGSLSVNSGPLGPLASGTPSVIAIDRPPLTGDTVDADLAVQPRIRVADRYNNPVGGAAVTVALGSGTGMLRGALTAVSDAAGWAAFTGLGYNKSGEKFFLHFASGNLSTDSGSLGPLPAGAAAQLRVETAANGSGTIVPAQNLAMNKTLTVYSVTRDQYGNYIAAAPGTWSLANKSGSFIDADLAAAPDNMSATLTGRHAGSAAIHVSSEALTSVDSGLITVTAPRIVRSQDGGGGGGRGGSLSLSLRPVGFTSNSGLVIGNDGVRTEATQLQTADGCLVLDIAAQTRLLNRSGGPLTQLTCSPLAAPPSPPDLSTIMLAYELGPGGATFDPPLTLTVKFGTLPAGLDEKTVRIMYWNGTLWQDLGGSLNIGSGIVTASISHLSQFAVVADPLPPGWFTLSDLTLTAAKVNPGETVSVSSEVTNLGGTAGRYQVSFKVNNAEVASQQIALEANQRQLLSFPVQCNGPGEYTVAINEKSSKFVVAGSPVKVLSLAPAPAVAPKPAPTRANAPASTPADAPASLTAPRPTASNLPVYALQPQLNWLLVLLVTLLGAGAVVTLAIILSRRPS